MPQGRIIFYLPYSFGDLESGSRVRPYQMYQAFLRHGYKVDLISGTPEERLARYKDVIASGENYDFCYAEASTYVLHPLIDYRILLGIHRLAIPVGLYYRDAYWKFNDYFHYKGLKRRELLLRYHMDFFLFSKIASVMFFPTESLAHLFKLRIPKKILPPAGLYRPLKREITSPLRAIYVGGVSVRYGTELMLESFRMVNEEKVNIILELVCRKIELEALPKRVLSLFHEPWVIIHHVSGEALQSIFARCHLAIIPRIKDDYNDLALPVKFFEYLSFGLPVITTNCKEISKFVEANGCGIICDDNTESMAEVLSSLLQKTEMISQLSNRAYDTILNGNLWDNRARTVANILNR